MNATVLYTQCSTFKGFIDLWNRERACPIPLVDVLLEYGMDKQAEVARWASEQPLKPVYCAGKGEINTACGTYPTYYGFHWGFAQQNKRLGFAHRLPGKINSELDLIGHTPIDCILKLLDNWTLSNED